MKKIVPVLFLFPLITSGVYGQDTNTTDVISSQYKINGDGTVKDLKTGLTWMQCAIGQQWKNNTCSGTAQRFNWQDATNIRESFAGHDDWRLPTIDELRTLTYCNNGKPEYFNLGKLGQDEYIQQEDEYEQGKGSKPDNFDWGCQGTPEKDHNTPTIAQNIFPNTPKTGFLTSSPNPYYKDNIWGVFFYTGNTANIHKDKKPYPIRLVRSED